MISTSHTEPLQAQNTVCHFIMFDLSSSITSFFNPDPKKDIMFYIKGAVCNILWFFNNPLVLQGHFKTVVQNVWLTVHVASLFISGLFTFFWP